MTVHKQSATKRVTDFADISLRALQVFSAVEETGSMTAAASRVGASRSAISQQIANLETLLGARLLDRTSRPLVLTPTGVTLLGYARRILAAMGEAQAELLGSSSSALAALRVGIIDDLDASITPELVKHLHDHFPHIDLSVSSGRSDDLTTQLEKRLADIVLSGEVPRDSLRYEDYPLLHEPFIAVAPAGIIDPSQDLSQQLNRLPYIRYNANMPMGRTIAQHLRRLRLNYQSPASFDASRSVFAMAHNCGGWAITTPLCLLDSRADRHLMQCFKLPFAGCSRTIRLMARHGEFGDLPANLAQAARVLFDDLLRREATGLPEWVAETTIILGDDGEPI